MRIHDLSWGYMRSHKKYGPSTVLTFIGYRLHYLSLNKNSVMFSISIVVENPGQLLEIRLAPQKYK